MRRVHPVLLLTVLATMIAVGCSRQPPPHVGEWDAQAYSEEKRFLGNASFHFFKDGDVQIGIEESSSPPDVREGEYRFDYSKNPITLDIGWKNGQSTVPYLYGIVQFVGERKDKMRIVYSTKVRPSSFQASEAFFWLTKKVNK